jgi:hypothetical protein
MRESTLGCFIRNGAIRPPPPVSFAQHAPLLWRRVSAPSRAGCLPLGPSAKELSSELSASSTTKAPEAIAGRALSAAKPPVNGRLPRVVHFTPIKKPASKTTLSWRYASRHEPMRPPSREFYMSRGSDEDRASEARGGSYRESRHWGGYYGGGERAYEDW